MKFRDQSANKWSWRVALLSVLGGLWAGPADAGVIMTEAEALARAFPGLKPERHSRVLTPAQVAQVEKLARAKVLSPEVTYFEAVRDGRLLGRAYLDTHKVRTMPESVLSVVSPEGHLNMALLLQFNDHPDYVPAPAWLRTLQGKQLDDGVAPGQGVPNIMGSTLSTVALTAAVRRAMAIEVVVMRGGQP